MNLIMDIRLVDRIMELLSKGKVMEEHFPMLLRTGIPDVGLTVHSHFLTFFTTVGQRLGYAAVTECPISWSTEDSKLFDLRADSVWFDVDNLQPRVIIEFERFERGDEAKLRQKVENLAIAAQATPKLDLSILVYWARSGYTPHSMDSVVSVYSKGFRRKGHSIRPATKPLIIIKCVMRNKNKENRLFFGEFLRDELNERLVAGRIS